MLFARLRSLYRLIPNYFALAPASKRSSFIIEKLHV